MPYNGSGTYSLPLNWETDRNDGITIQASRMMTQEQDIADGLTNALCKDGQSTPTANLPMGGFKLTNLGDATNATDALNRQTGDARYPAIVGTSVDNVVVRFDGTSGQQQLSLLLIDDSGNIAPRTHDTGDLGTDALRFGNAWLASGAVITWGGASSADVTLTHSANALAFAGASSGYSFDAALTVPNTGLRMLDTNASHGLTLKPGSDLTGEKTLTVTTGDNDRTLDISGADTTISAYGATLVDDADAATARGTLQLVNSTTDNELIRADGTAGKTQTSGIIVSDTKAVSGALSYAAVVTDFTEALSLQSTEASASIWKAAVLYRNSATPAANDFLAGLVFRGKDNGANDADYVQIVAQALDVTDGSEDGALIFRALVGGANTDLAIWGPGLQVGTPSGGDKGIGTVNAQTGLYVGGNAAAILGGTNVGDLTIQSTDAGASLGPTLSLFRNSASPASNDFIGQLLFQGKDSAGNTEDYAGIFAFITDPTSTTEDALLVFKTDVAGTLTDRLKIAAGLYTPNATGADKGVDTINAGEYFLNGISQKRLYKSITSDAAGQNVNTAQPWFPTNGGVTLASNKTYRVDGLIYFFRAAGTTSHTTRFLFGGTATVSSMLVHVAVNNGDVGTFDTINRTVIVATSGAVVKAASTSATEAITMRVSGIVRVTTGGTLIPQFQYSAAPGGAPTIQSGSFFELFEIGADTDVAVGTWS